MRVRAFVLSAALIASTAVAQNTPEIQIGNWIAVDRSDSGSELVRTDIDLIHPATGSGKITRVVFKWSGGSCKDVAKIKFFRRTGDALTLTAERGPFSFPFDGTAIALSVPVDVIEGDLIGIARVSDCGSPAVSFDPPRDKVQPGYLQYGGDVSETIQMAEGRGQAGYLAVGAAGEAVEYTAGILPVVGSATGQMGSTWKTEVQLAGHRSSTKATGRLVFHRAGVQGAMSDPAIRYSLEPGQTVTFPDIVAAIGETGFGSLDLVVESGTAPHIIGRIFNGGAAGETHGVVEDVVDPNAWDLWCWGCPDYPGTPVLERNVTGFLLTPDSPSEARFNIGVRTLAVGATIVATHRDSDGRLLHTKTNVYGPNQFEQVSAEHFLGGPIGPNQSIRIALKEGTAIVYGVATDNKTNDPAIQHVEGALRDSRSDAARTQLGSAAFGQTAIPIQPPAWTLPIVAGFPAGNPVGQWRTALQLFNPDESREIPVQLVFRFQRTQNSSTDPSTSFSLAPGQVKFIPDIGATFEQAGAGTLDVFVANGSPLPVVVGRLISGHESGGNAGMLVEAVDPGYMSSVAGTTAGGGLFGPPSLEEHGVGYMVMPASPAETAFEIGVRTGWVRTTVFGAVFSRTGHFVKSFSKTYQPYWSEQVSAEEFFGIGIEGGESVRFAVEEGFLTIYGVAIDRKTNDPAIQYVRSRWPNY